MINPSTIAHLYGRLLVIAGACLVSNLACSQPAADPSSGEAGAVSDKPSFRFGGFLDGLPAYTYSSPTHWSRAVARLQLTAQGEFADQVQWKLGARVDVDPVYYSSNFYLQPVKQNQRLDVFYRENYLDFSAG